MQSSPPSCDLNELAKQSMLEHHLLPEFPAAALQEVNQIQEPKFTPSASLKDKRDLLWFSIDNDDSKDLDQLTYAEKTDQQYKIYIAIADVDSLVKKGSAIDQYAQQNTTSVYTPTRIFSMLPVQLSTDLTSLNEDEDRLTIVAEVNIGLDGAIGSYALYPALVRNQAKLAYNSVAAWLDNKGPAPARIQTVAGLADQVRLQDEITKILRNYRHVQGALTLETIEPMPIMENNKVVDLKVSPINRARDLIEDFMIAANTSTARFLKEHQFASLRRVVRVPKRWDRIVAIAKEQGEVLPETPDAKALDLFLIKRRLLDPVHFPDLSLTVIKLLGNGEYIVEYPGDTSVGHFSLAVKDYTHFTAPNRRYPDLITQRLVKAALNNQPTPYTSDELEYLAKQCTQKEDEAEKVERQMRKSAAALLLSTKINQTFDALVTGASDKGTWVRILQPPVEGKLIQGYEHLDVGDALRVKLMHVDVERGFIDFIRT